MSEQTVDKRVSIDNIIRAKTYGTNGAKVTSIESATRAVADVTQYWRFDDPKLGDEELHIPLHYEEWVAIGKRMGWKMPD